jgi:hypothetical protein
VCRLTPRRFLSQGGGNGRWIVWKYGNVGTTERKRPAPASEQVLYRQRFCDD